MQHTLCMANSIEQFIKNISHELTKNDVVNLLIKNHTHLSNDSFSSIRLTDIELYRANNFINNNDKSSFSIRRKILKAILLKLTGSAEILTLVNGKPISKIGNFCFSHSNKNLSLFYSFSNKYEVGADIEEISSNIDFLTIATLFFSQNEKKLFQNRKSHQKLNFFRMWTQKEALAKCANQPLQVTLKTDLSSSKSKNRVRVHLTDRDYYLYSYQRKQHYISIATNEFTKTMKTYELKQDGL